MPRPARRSSSGPSLPPPSLPRPSLPGLILTAAEDIERVSTSLDAELLLSTLLGSGYARLAPDRGAGLDALVDQLADQAAEQDTGPARAVAVLLSGPGAVRPTGGYAYGDRYGDQSGYVATFAQDGDADGPEHAVVFLVDHTLGLVKDILVISPASEALDQFTADPDEMSWSAPMDPASVRVAAGAYLHATDIADELPGAESLVANRWLAGRRLALLPEAPAEAADPGGAPAPERDELAGRDELVAQFMESPEARLSGLARAGGAQREAVEYGLGLCVGYAVARGGDPLRWSPLAVESFLLDWIHQRAVLDAQDVTTLPDVLSAWVSWAGRRVGLPESAVAATLDRIDALRAEFARLGTTGERQSPAVRATAQLVAEGVDLADPAAVDEWLATYNASH
jgi:hypothetical protein